MIRLISKIQKKHIVDIPDFSSLTGGGSSPSISKSRHLCTVISDKYARSCV